MSAQHVPIRGAASHSVDEIDATYSKISWRLLPFLGVLWVLAWLDRVNIGFAKLQMLDDLKFSEAVTAWAPASSSSVTSCSKCPPTRCCKDRRQENGDAHHHRLGHHLHLAGLGDYLYPVLHPALSARCL